MTQPGETAQYNHNLGRQYSILKLKKGDNTVTVWGDEIKRKDQAMRGNTVAKWGAGTTQSPSGETGQDSQTGQGDRKAQSHHEETEQPSHNPKRRNNTVTTWRGRTVHSQPRETGLNNHNLGDRAAQSPPGEPGQHSHHLGRRDSRVTTYGDGQRNHILRMCANPVIFYL